MADETVLLRGEADFAKMKSEIGAAREQLKALQDLGASGAQSAGTLKAFGFSDDEAIAGAQRIVAEEHSRATAAILLGEQQRASAVEQTARRVSQANADAWLGSNRVAGGDASALAALAGAESTAAIDDAATKAARLAGGVDEIGKSAAIAKRELRDLAGGLGLISPQLGLLVRMFGEAREGLDALSKHFMTLLKFGGPIVALVAAFGELTETIQEAEAAARAFADQQERIRQAGVEVETSVAQQLGKQGRGSEAAFTAATAEAKRLRDAGFSGSTADQVAAALTGDEGQLLVDAADVELFAAAAERGDIELGGKTQRERARNLRKAQRTVGRNRDALAASAQAFARPRQRQAEAAAQGRVPESAAIGQELLGLSPEEAQQRARDFAEVERRGEDAVLGGFEDEGVFTELSQDFNTAVKGAVGLDESARMQRVRRAREFGATMRTNQQRRAGEAERRSEGDPEVKQLLQRIAVGIETQKAPQVNVNVAGQGKAPVPAPSRGPRRRP